MTWGMTAVAGATLVGGYLGAEGAQDAAQISADASARASQLQYDQYLQNRQDLMPWMDVARGNQERQFNPEQFDPYNPEEAVRFIQAMRAGEVDQQGYSLDESGERVGGAGALGELAGYGRSDVLSGDYIPASDVPSFAPSSDIQDFNIRGDQPVFDPTVDMERDPGVAFRRQEQERAINRNMAGMGKLLSGNRMEELMARGGDLASQEYGQAYGRNLGEYELGRAREATGFARDLTGFEQNRLAEEARYGRDVTGYNAEMARENLLYGRGVGEYGRQYGSETDYLNRLASLSKVGQQTALGVGNMGTQAAASVGANTIGAGNAQAAAQMGQASAWQNAIGDFTTLGTQYAMNQNQPSYTTGAGGSYGYNYPQGVPTNEWVNNPRY